MIAKTIFIGNPASLRLKDRQVVIKLKEGETVRTIPVEDIGLLVLEHPQITLSNALLAYLLEQNTGVISCGRNHHPAGYWLPLTGHSEYAGHVRHQVAATKPLQKQLWAQTVRVKVMNQGLTLQMYDLPWKRLKRWAEAVRSDDKTNVEAMAAAYYWKRLFCDHVEGFVRDRYGEPPNHLLNYGYAILRALVARTLTASGLMPLLGMHHRNQYNPFCLADDVMEPYRPFVDQQVKQMLLAGRAVTLYELSKEDKKTLLQLPTLDVQMENQRSPLAVALQHTTSSLVKCYKGEQRKISYPTLPTV